jgi:hypothetical protein
MVSYFFVLFIIVGVFVTIMDWRRGLFMMVIIAALQDPIRKLMPGTPSYFVLAGTPIWAAIIVIAFTKVPHLWMRFKGSHRQLALSMKILVIAMIPAALLSASYGTNSWRFTLLGFFSYGGLLLGWLIGFVYARDEKDITRLMAFYCLVTSVMLLGTHIQYLGLASAWPAIGTEALGMEWVRYTDFGPVNLYAGFYRSPDVMGWHAVMAAMFSSLLAFREKKSRRIFWFIVAAWAIGAAMLCGRRKMILMLPLFGLIFSWIYWRARSTTKAAFIVGMLALIFVAGYTVYNVTSADEGIEQYYVHYFWNAPARVKSHGIDSVLETYRQFGFFGAGLGFAVQGSQNVEGDKPRVWQEGGLEKVLVELGVPGFLSFIFLAAALVRALLKVVFDQLSPGLPEFPIFAGLAAIVLANACSFVASHQIFGDFFILVFFSFLTGVLFSRGASPAVQGLPK